MFTSSLTEEVKALEADIEAVKEKVDDPIMCAKIRQFVYAPREIQDLYKADAGTQGLFSSCYFPSEDTFASLRTYEPSDRRAPFA
jgi:hypothetical protein